MADKPVYILTYKGVDNGPSVKHWKYIKRERVNGKWKYYYDTGAKIRDTKSVLNKVRDANPYAVTEKTYDAKMAALMKTKEWQDIVARNDPEYVKVMEDGTKKYLVDDYLVKKKHPGLDLLDDFANGRDPSINKVNKDTVLAGANDYIRAAKNVAMVAAKVLTEKFKYQQGSYKDTKQQMQSSATQGVAVVNSILKMLNGGRR